MRRKNKRYEAVVIGGSAGSMEVMLSFFSLLPPHFYFPITVICHLHPEDDGGMVELFKSKLQIKVLEAREKEKLQTGHIYFPPANYHLLVERDCTFALSKDKKVHFSRPSIDVFFESAAVCWAEKLIGIILTGASADGAEGIRAIKKHGGLTLAQDPDEATYAVMPQAAIDTGCVDTVLPTAEIGDFLSEIAGRVRRITQE